MAQLNAPDSFANWPDERWDELAREYSMAGHARQEEIRLFFEAKHQPFLRRTLLGVLIAEHGPQSAKDLLGKAADWVNARLFGPDPFAGTMGLYDPGVGKVNRFIKRKILWRCLDVRGIGGPTEEPPALLSAREKLSVLRPCLDLLKGQSDFGVHARAVFDLYYVALVWASEIDRVTLSAVRAAKGSEAEEAVSRLKSEHDVDSERFDDFTRAVFGKAWDALDRAVKGLQRAQEALDPGGEPCVGEELEELQREALDRTNSDIKAEEGGLPRGDARRAKLGYMARYLSLTRAEDRFESIRKRCEDIHDSAWHRSQSRVGKFLGVSQSTVSRRLVEAWQFLESCVRQLAGGQTDDKEASED